MHRLNPKEVINVSKVRHISPFRYPGGKTWFVPYVRKWISSIKYKPAIFIEPFAGGASVALTVAAENLADKVVISEIDEYITDVWNTIISDDFNWLIKRIQNFDMNTENVDLALSKEAFSKKERAFQTLLRNRINHGGIIAPGAGRIKNGEKGKGIGSRWYPKTIGQRILMINAIRKKIEVISGDGFEVIKRFNNSKDNLFFIDPPYTAGKKKAGRRLYRYSEINHEELFKLADTINGNFLMTYENSEEIKDLVVKYNFEMKKVAMQNTHLAKMKELIISRDLSWLDNN